MALELDIQSLLDIGLLLLLAFGAFQLFASKSSGTSDSTKAAWKGELQSLEESLRELIGEAGAASRNLDRNLLQRKRELESLLKDLDASEQRVTSNEKKVASSEAELPNDTWAETAPQRAAETTATPKRAPTPPITGYGAGGIAKKSQATKAAVQNAPVTNAPVTSAPVTNTPVKNSPVEKALTPQAALEKVVSSAGGTMALSQQVTREVLRQQAEKRGVNDKEHAASQALADKLEEANERMELDESERLTFESTSIMDPVTYRIARRLLVDGKEIHIVARKLDMPVSEIRLLDRLIRRETQGDEIDGGDMQGDGFPAEDAELGEETLLHAPAAQQGLASQIESSSSPLTESRGEGSFTAGMGRFESEALFDPKAAQPFVAEDVAEVEKATPVLSAANDLDQDIERELALL